MSSNSDAQRTDWSGRPAALKLVAHHELDSTRHIDFHNKTLRCRVVATLLLLLSVIVLQSALLLLSFSFDMVIPSLLVMLLILVVLLLLLLSLLQ